MEGAGAGAGGAPGAGEMSPHVAKLKLGIFLREFEGPDGGRVYRDRILRCLPTGADMGARVWARFAVELEDLRAFDDDLAQALVERPAELLPLLEAAARDSAARFLGKGGAPDGSAAPEDGSAPPEAPSVKDLPRLQVELRSAQAFGPASLRDLGAASVGNLVRVRGIVTAASKIKAKASVVKLKCRDCLNTLDVVVRPGIAAISVPRKCMLSSTAPGDQRCSLDPFVAIPSGSVFEDQQTLKLQERPEDVPPGELPRSCLVTVDRALTLKATPGSRVTVTGVFSIYNAQAGKGKGAGAAVRNPYVRAVGIEHDAEGAGDRSAPVFTERELQEFREFAARPDCLAAIHSRVAPSIFGHEDVKRAVACALFAGCRKHLPSGARLRGDINVLLLGDPSTAKSQFLKFAERSAPVAVYTSGKGSSAAGLTASVLRDPNSGEFYLEGGAMVLADGGIVCIDEFDKMRAEDRVAIHEAMEQQTISIAKAGITTVLNARAGVLAAANPPSGRYDDLRTAQENIELQQTILSRFDLIFIVRDERSFERDMQIAAHVVGVHKRAGGPELRTDEERREEEGFLRRYVEFCRAKCQPRLSDEATEVLQDEYVRIRQGNREKAAQQGGGATAIPITVRQLEALVRISESLAKMQLCDQVGTEHVREALRLFQVSTVDATKSGVAEGIVFTPEQRAECAAIAEQVKARVPVGGRASLRRLVEEVARLGFSEGAVRRAVVFLSQQGEIEEARGGMEVKRVR